MIGHMSSPLLRQKTHACACNIRWAQRKKGMAIPWTLHSKPEAQPTGKGRAPDDERLALVALRGECYDVVAALQLRKGVLQGVAPQLHAARASRAVHHA